MIEYSDRRKEKYFSQEGEDDLYEKIKNQSSSYSNRRRIHDRAKDAKIDIAGHSWIQKPFNYTSTRAFYFLNKK